MPTFVRDDISLYYEIHGEGFPILLFAPGGMRSALSFWKSSPWNPITELSKHFKVIAMDQRNAGQSRAPVTAEDGWHSYTEDHIALLDHLEIRQCHLMGGCIGGPYSFGLIKAQQNRVASAIIQQTIGLENNREVFYEMFDAWSPNLTATNEMDLASFRSNMYDHDFLFNVNEAFVEQCSTPLLVLMGDDIYHPQSISRKVAKLASNATLVESWSGDDVIEQTIATSIEFLKRNTPG